MSKLWKGRTVEDILPGKEGGAVKLECQGCGKEWLRPAAKGCGAVGGGVVWLRVSDHVGVTSINDNVRV